MNVAFEHKGPMTLIGYSTSIRMEEGYQKCPEFWNTAYTQRYAPGARRAEDGEDGFLDDDNRHPVSEAGTES